MWLIFSVLGEVSVSPPQRLSGCSRDWKAPPPCLAAAPARLLPLPLIQGRFWDGPFRALSPGMFYLEQW